MEFGKVENVDAVDFTFPETEAETLLLLQEYPNNQAILHIGAPVIPGKEMEGILFPPKTAAKAYFGLYSRQFTTIEFNTTHYRIPPVAQIEKWVNETADNFRFFPKMPQRISHTYSLASKVENALYFCDIIRNFGNKLGGVFMQLPPYFSPAHGKELEKFLFAFPGDIPLHIEFRHEQWFSDRKVFYQTMDTLQQCGVGAVITDTSGRRDVLHTRLTVPNAVIRYVGNENHPSDYRRLTDWAKRIAEWEQAGLQEVFFFLHAPQRAEFPALSNYFIRELNRFRKTKLTDIRFWENRSDKSNDQISLW